MTLMNLLLIVSLSLNIIIFIQIILRRRKVYDFHMLILAMSIWLFFELIHYNIDDVYYLNLTNNLRYIGIVLVPVFGFTFSVKYSKSIHSISKPLYIALLIIPIFSLTSILTNNYHHMFYYKTTRQIIQGMSFLTVDYGPIFYIHTIYSYSLILVMQYNILRVAIKHKGSLRFQSILLIVAALIPFFGNAIFLVSNSVYDYTPLTFTLTTIMIYTALHRAKFFDALPIGHNMVIDQIDIGYIIINETNQIIDMNNNVELILGINLDKWMLKPFGNLMKFLNTTLYDHEFTIYHDGKIINCISQSINDSREVGIGKVFTFSDVTKSIQAKIQLENEKNEALIDCQNKSRFFNSITHELRMPIEGLLEMSRQTENFSNEHAPKIIEDSCYLCLNILKELENMTITKDYSIDICNQFVNLEDVIKEMQMTFDPIFEKSDIDYKIHYPNNMRLYGLIDKHHLEQILVNLLNNIVKFAKHGSMTISMSLIENILSIDFDIQGFSIPKEVMPFVFEAKSVALDDFNQISLGLSLTKRIAKAMEGDIQCSSNHVDRTNFQIDLRFDEIDQTIPTDTTVYKDIDVGIILSSPLEKSLVAKYLESVGISVTLLNEKELHSEQMEHLLILIIDDQVLDNQNNIDIISSLSISHLKRLLLSCKSDLRIGDYKTSALVNATISRPFSLPDILEEIHKIITKTEENH